MADPRPSKRLRTGRGLLRSFHQDWIPVEDDEADDFVHAREGSLQRKGNHLRMSVMPRVAERTSDTDPWLSATFWPTPDSTEFALDQDCDMYDQAVEADIMEEVVPAKPKKRKKASKVSARPHVVWKEKYRQIFLDEMLRWSGRGDFQYADKCPDCLARSSSNPGLPEYRCSECLVSDLTCGSCCVRRHRQHPFHRIEKWNGQKFTSVSLKSLGLKIQLNHSGSFCENPIPAQSNMLILHTNGIHEVALSYCGCTRAIPHNIQLLRRQLYPASHIRIRTCATFQLLNSLHKFALTTKASTYDFYRALEKLTNNTGMDVPKSRYKPLCRMILQWRHLKMLKWGGRGNDTTGVEGTKTGELALRCPSCPHPGINLPENWQNVSEEYKYLFLMIICMDANFRLKNQVVSNYSQDPGLGIGWAYLLPRHEYESYVLSRASDEDISTCVGFQALAKANTKFSVGLRYTGVGAAVYANMDFIFGSVLQYVMVLLVLISYDVACQWFTNLLARIEGHWPESIKPRSTITLIPAIPKLHEPMHQQQNHQVYSLNFIKGVGLSDCECPERVWAPHNALSNSTKTQGPGSRHDVLDDHFHFWNWLKYIGLGRTLLRRYKAAVAQRNLQQEGHRGLTASLDTAVVAKWEKMCEKWDAEPFPKKSQNPYCSKDTYLSEAKVRKELADEEERRIKAGGVSVHETPAAVFVQMGLELEETQRRLRRLDKTITAKISTTLGDKSTLTEERNNFRVRRKAWEKLLPIYMPGILQYKADFAKEDPQTSVSSNKAEDVTIWLPSLIPQSRRPHICYDGLAEVEERLREAQCTDSLRKLRRILRVKSRMIHFKNKNVRGQREGTRSRSVIDRVHLKARNAADRYRACREAKLALSGPGKWEENFRVLDNSDIRGYQDPDRLRPKVGRKGTLEDGQAPGVTADNAEQDFELFNEVRTRRDGTGETRRTLSWIWTTSSADGEGDKDEILRVEWAKSRARAARAAEEVMLLKEEMRRVLEYLGWKAMWWRERLDSRGGLDKALTEGVKAFATGQADLQLQLASHFRALWKSPLEDSESDRKTIFESCAEMTAQPDTVNHDEGEGVDDGSDKGSDSEDEGIDREDHDEEQPDDEDEDDEGEDFW
ncbi:hypothetical protein CVT26_008093 [Gymnopilus dilepis]|uniref:CxC2-like cysteine cluster KDZ transposase-associated domain-containing protein n=1 Tax=Gymnopilus dilepis TaxID=231916 RepID=A0A409WFB7_9AGAR|nr:hypothetical protein CVT26_008093 [Gymnopilus dilepis]